MNVIHTCKFAMLRRLTWAVVLVALCILPALVWADVPPQPLLNYISSHKLINSKKCDVPFLNVKSTECMVYLDKKKDRIWVVLFDSKLNITHVIVNNKGKEELVWCRDNVCI